MSSTLLSKFRNKYAIAGVTVAVAVVAYLLFSRPESGDNVSGLITGRNVIYVPEQKPGNIVLVELVRLEGRGYIAIYETDGEQPGEFLGVSSILHAGESKKVGVFVVRDLKDGEELMAILRRDNGDGKFDANLDLPFRENGEPVFSLFIVDKDAELPADVSL